MDILNILRCNFEAQVAQHIFKDQNRLVRHLQESFKIRVSRTNGSTNVSFTLRAFCHDYYKETYINLRKYQQLNQLVLVYRPIFQLLVDVSQKRYFILYHTILTDSRKL